jgi:magnesium transporter
MPGDWLRIAFRELYTGAALGVLLALVGFARVWLNPPVADNPALLANIALTISGALVGVVTVGSMVGAILPIFFKKLGADPAVTSSPFIATLVDVTGIVIYFSVAHIFLAAAFEHAAALKAAAGG